jgi:hypothetical protein
MQFLVVEACLAVDNASELKGVHVLEAADDGSHGGRYRGILHLAGGS